MAKPNRRENTSAASGKTLEAQKKSTAYNARDPFIQGPLPKDNGGRQSTITTEAGAPMPRISDPLDAVTTDPLKGAPTQSWNEDMAEPERAAQTMSNGLTNTIQIKSQIPS